MDRYGRQPISAECALASDIFDHFCTAPTLKTILGYHRNLCETLQLKPTRLPDFYPKLKAKLAKSWKAQALFKKFDARAAHKCYQRGEATPHTKVLIIGAGPCGLRTAIDAQLLGAKVVVVEKRDRMSRNNVLHLWPFVIQDLRALGAKKFFGKFCAGAIDHISIRQLQCILLKVALCLGVEIHESVGFEELIEPNEGMGWRARVTPEDHPVSQYEFDVLIGADGKRNTLEGFKRKEFRGKLAIAITANFINKRSEAEAKVEEISGVAFIFNQKFFKDLYATTGIDLENIVYYKDDTHYFVMTAKKHSLIDKGVIIQDFPDTAKLLHLENVDNDALKQYAREAAEFSTEYQMPNMEFAVNHYGKPDVAMFDFTSMYAAENASRVLQRKGHRLLMCLVGDSLLEPFWPTGSGCARGFLSALDACWAIRSWGANANPLEILSQRESIYRLLGQTTPENLQRDTASYSLEPSSRYPNLNRASVLPFQVKSLYDTDDPSVLDILPATIIPETVDVPKKRRRRDTQIHPETLLHWINFQIASCDLQIESLSHILENGLILCAVLHRYRPDLINYADRVDKNPEENNKLAVHIMDQELGVPGTLFMNGDKPDMASLLIYLTQVYYTFRGEIPHIKHPKLEMPEKRNDYNAHTAFAKLAKMASEKKQMVPTITDLDLASGSVLPHSNLPHRRSRKPSTEVAQQAERMKGDAARKAKKRRSADKFGGLTVEERQKKLQEIAANRNDRQSKRRYHCQLQKQNFYKSLHMLQSNAKRDTDIPFEDYSIYLYRQSAPEFGHRVKELERKLLYPDRERGIGLPVGRGPLDQDFSSRVKNIEDQFRGAAPSEKKPRDLLRAIGKIESSDWNVKEIEKKILESKKAPEQSLQKERVPKWSKEQFLARKHKMASKGLERQDSSGGKFKEIDNTLRHVEKQLKEPALLALSKNSNKVASIAGNFSKDTKEEDLSDKKNGSSSNKPAASTMFANRDNSELCHYCNKRVYLMERLCVEGLSFHRRCLRCTHCGTTLRIGSCAFDKDGKVYCTQHVGLPGKTMAKKKEKTPIKAEDKYRTPDKPKTRLTDVTGLDILDRGQTPERIEYENLAVESDEERSLSPMDEEEWTDRNFGASAAENHSSDERASDSDLSSENDDEEEYSEALDNLDTIEGVQNYFKVYSEWTKKYGRSHKSPGDQNYESSSDEFYHEYSTDDDDSDDSDTQTEGEEEVRARELRRREVPANRPPPNKYTDTEVASEDETSTATSSEALNSATEISTDSEFEHDGTTPVRDPPSIFVDDSYVNKTRGTYHRTKVQVKSAVIENPINGNVRGIENGFSKQKSASSKKFGEDKLSKAPTGIELNIRPLVEMDTELVNKFGSQKEHNLAPLVNPRPGDYLLKHTQSTSGIASKKSLELKKRYLLGGDVIAGTIQKSGSASALDSRFKSFHSNISECQKLLNPAPEPSPTMQAILQGASRIREGPLSPSLQGVGFFKTSPVSLSSDKINTKPESASPVPSKTENSAEIIDLTLSPVPVTKLDVIDLTLSPVESQIGRNNATSTSPLKPDLINIPISPNRSDGSTSLSKGNSNADNSLVLEQVVEQQTENVKSPEVNNVSKLETNEIDNAETQQSDSEFRARSPVHETSIVVPDIEWDKKNVDHKSESDVETDSLSSSDSLSGDEIENNKYNALVSRSPSPERSVSNHFVPQIAVTDTSGELMQVDSLMIVDGKYVGDPEDLVNLENLPSVKPNADQKVSAKKRSDSESGNEITAALTETELSDWAIDDAVSDNLVDVEFNINPEFANIRKQKKPKMIKKQKQTVESSARIAKSEDFDDLGHICGKEKLPELARNIAPSIEQNLDIDDIEFMDTGSEDSCIENVAAAANTAVLQNRGYVEFVDNNLSTPVINKRDSVNDSMSAQCEVVETFNRDIGIQIKGIDYIEQGACILNNDIKSVIEKSTSKEMNVEQSVKPRTEPLSEDQCKESVSSFEQEEDSLVIPESTDTTTSDALTVVTSPLETPSKSYSDEKQDKTLQPKSQQSTAEPSKESAGQTSMERNDVNKVGSNDHQVYEDYVKRLDLKVAGFGNVRDSIDVRKSRKKSKGSIQKPDDIIETEEKNSASLQSNVVPSKPVPDVEHIPSTINPMFNTNFNSTATSKKLEEISRERVKQKDLIHEMVMDKLQNKKMLNAEKRLSRSRSRSSFSPGSGVPSKPDLIKTQPLNMPTVGKVDISNQRSYNNLDQNIESSTSVSKSTILTSDKTKIPLQKSPTDIILNKEKSDICSPFDRRHSVSQSTPLSFEPDSLIIIPDNQLTATPLTSFKKLSQPMLLRPFSVHSSFKIQTSQKDCTSPLPDTPLTNPEVFSLPDMRKKLLEESRSFKTPVAPPRLKNEETKRTADKLREDARTRARLKSDQDLGLSPEDRIRQLRQKAGKKYAFDSDTSGIQSLSVDDSCESITNSGLDTSKKVNGVVMRPSRTKSVNDLVRRSVHSPDTGKMHKSQMDVKSAEVVMKPVFCTSDPNLLTDNTKSDKKLKSKDRERRKSIIQTVSDFFYKKKEPSSMPTSPTGKDSNFILSKFRISPKSKDKSKSCFDLEEHCKYLRENTTEPIRNRCQSDAALRSVRCTIEEQAPPIPPPPLNYDPAHRLSDDSHSEDFEVRRKSLETSDIADSSLALNSLHLGENSSSEPRKSRRSRAAKQAQMKRLRKAHEIQRDLEETDVKQRELEAKGVAIEKTLRGEGSSDHDLEEKLLYTWVKLRREQKELQLYEHQLRVNKQELQLEDRHADLQLELRERLAQDDTSKTSADIAREGAILNEMMEIVAEHDALVIERERLRNLERSPQMSDETASRSPITQHEQ